jgi:hypothetical protein
VSRKPKHRSARNAGSEQNSRIETTAELLLPIVQTLLRGGIAFADFVHAAKFAYVRAAIRDIASTARRQNASRIAALTGLTRREIKILLQHSGAPSLIRGAGESAQPLSRIVDAWRQDRAFLTTNGKPRLLKLSGPIGTFESLVTAHGGDITVVAALKELERVGCIRRIGTHRVQLVRNKVELKGYSSEALSGYGRRLNDFAEVLSSKFQQSDRASYVAFRDSTEVPLELASLFRNVFSERAQILLDGFDTWTKRNSSRRKSDAGPRIGIGVYIVEPNTMDK